MGFSKNLSDAANKIASAATDLTVTAVVESSSGGFKFPDGTIQTTAAAGKAVKVVYIGDSLGGTPLWGKTLPDWLETMVNGAGVACKVVNCGKDAATFYRANTQADFGAQTAVQRAIAEKPDVAIVVLGFNDVVYAVDGRTIGQVEADAVTLFAALRAGLPSAHIVLLQEIVYDTTSGHVPSGFVNRHIIPALHNIPTTGVNANCRVGEILSSAIAAGTANSIADLTTVYGNVISAGVTAGTITSAGLLDVFRPLFFGCHIGDGIHPDEVGAMFLANDVYKHLRSSVAEFANLKTNGQPAYHDFDELFTLGVVDAGTHYAPAGPSHNEVYRVGRALGVDLHHRINTWYLSIPLSITYNKLSIENSTADHYMYAMRGGLPGAGMDIRVWLSTDPEPSTWSPSGLSFDTSGSLEAIEHGSALGLSVGTYKIKYSTIAADGLRDVVGPISVSLY
jgi:lysophospholipase L1-like esterase